MPNNIIQLNEEVVKSELKELVKKAWRRHWMSYWTRKRMSSPMPEGMNERKPVRDTDPDTTAASSPSQPEK